MSDLERVAKVEKAIAEKYGEDASRDIRHFWDKEKELEYSRQIKEEYTKRNNLDRHKNEVEKEGFVLIRRKGESNHASQCPICDKFLSSADDDIYYNKFECCSGCFIQYVEDRESQWSDKKKVLLESKDK